MHESAPPPLQFPYMFWMQTQSFQAPYCLAQSGMPVPDAAILGGLEPEEILAHAGVDALPRLQRQIAEMHGVPAERVVIAVGASGAMALCAQRWFRPGARVVSDLPSYEPFRALPEQHGAELRLVQRRPEDQWRLSAEAVERALAGASGPAHLFLSNPHNPTGALATPEEIRGFAELAERAGGVLVSCEVYMDFLPGRRRYFAHELAPNGVTIGSLTKAWGLGPLRVGWIVLGEGLADQRDSLVDMGFLTWVDAPTASLNLASRALAKMAVLREPLSRIERSSRPLWADWLRGEQALDSFVPDYGIIAFPRVRDVDDTFALTQYLASTHGVTIGAGEYFGMPGHVRIGCGVPETTLDEALARLSTGLRAWRSERG